MTRMTQVLGRMLTTSYPLCLIAMEAAAQMERRRLDLALNWIPRECNEEADALSNLRFGDFCVAKLSVGCIRQCQTRRPCSKMWKTIIVSCFF